jgi:uncharacterized protein
MTDPQSLVQVYKLSPHPEGGYFKENYRSVGLIPGNVLPATFGGERNYSTAIYFLLEKGDFSAFHKISSDEVWNFYAGDPLHVFVIHPDGSLEVIKLGNNIVEEETFQAVVPSGCWFASVPTGPFSFVGCTVAPGFDFNDFEMANAEILVKEYPQHEQIIRKLCR